MGNPMIDHGHPLGPKPCADWWRISPPHFKEAIRLHPVPKVSMDFQTSTFVKVSVAKKRFTTSHYPSVRKIRG